MNGMMKFQGTRRKFLARPFWRDYVLAYVLIALGFMLSAPNSPAAGFGVVILACGAANFLCAIGWSLCSTWRAWWSRGAA